MDLDIILNQIYALPRASRELIKAYVTEVVYPKGHIIIHANKVERHVYFLKSGIVRAYADHGDSQITFWIGSEGAPVISMNSYVNNRPGYESIDLLENCTLYTIAMQDLQRLFLQDIHIANWGRKFAESELIKTEERMISRHLGTAVERYRRFLSQSPDLLQRVPLGYIASYLGITQVSLSRIRAEIR
ncbi:MAG: Crp/Fnr family transcriptional regulator [Sphingobacteriales bacterium]|nr:MAG: Crp/Fnr family transcriptional regulator [Sphingobacteriales bacterium]